MNVCEQNPIRRHRLLVKNFLLTRIARRWNSPRGKQPINRNVRDLRGGTPPPQQKINSVQSLCFQVNVPEDETATGLFLALRQANMERRRCCRTLRCCVAVVLLLCRFVGRVGAEQMLSISVKLCNTPARIRDHPAVVPALRASAIRRGCGAKMNLHQ